MADNETLIRRLSAVKNNRDISLIMDDGTLHAKALYFQRRLEFMDRFDGLKRKLMVTWGNWIPLMMIAKYEDALPDYHIGEGVNNFDEFDDRLR